MNIKKLVYSSGDIFLPEKIKKLLVTDLIGTSTKTFYVSGWSIVHFVTGIIFGYLYLFFNYYNLFYIIRLFIIHTMWEFWQTLIGMAKPYKLTGRSNLIDSIIDTVFFMLGVYIVNVSIIE